MTHVFGASQWVARTHVAVIATGHVASYLLLMRALIPVVELFLTAGRGGAV